MSLNVSGIVCIPQEPCVEVVNAPSGKGAFINFRCVTENKGSEDYQNWNAAIWVPDDDTKEKILTALSPGTIFYIEHANIVSIKNNNSKFTNAKLKIEFSKFRKLSTPLWLGKK